MKIDCIERVLKDTNTSALDPTGDQHEVIHIDKMCQVKVLPPPQALMPHGKITISTSRGPAESCEQNMVCLTPMS